jgi:hypothetical protein
MSSGPKGSAECIAVEKSSIIPVKDMDFIIRCLLYISDLLIFKDNTRMTINNP